MKDTLELPEQTDLELSTEYSETEGSLHTVRQWMKENKELRPIIKGSVDQEYIDKYIEFSKKMDHVLTVVEEFSCIS